MRTPSHSSPSSSTKGSRYAFMLILGSLGPGSTPTKIIFSSLNRSSPGKFKIARYMTPTEYGECLKGWYQSTFIISAKLWGSARNGCPLTYWKSYQIFPSYTSPITASGMFRCLHCSQAFLQNLREFEWRSLRVDSYGTQVLFTTWADKLPHQRSPTFLSSFRLSVFVERNITTCVADFWTSSSDGIWFPKSVSCHTLGTYWQKLSLLMLLHFLRECKVLGFFQPAHWVYQLADHVPWAHELSYALQECQECIVRYLENSLPCQKHKFKQFHHPVSMAVLSGTICMCISLSFNVGIFQHLLFHNNVLWITAAIIIWRLWRWSTPLCECSWYKVICNINTKFNSHRWKYTPAIAQNESLSYYLFDKKNNI